MVVADLDHAQLSILIEAASAQLRQNVIAHISCFLLLPVYCLLIPIMYICLLNRRLDLCLSSSKCGLFAGDDSKGGGRYDVQGCVQTSDEPK